MAYPLEQGLKHSLCGFGNSLLSSVLMAYPLEQGLKQLKGTLELSDRAGLNGLSTRTRIETLSVPPGNRRSSNVLMAYPLEQGLKPFAVQLTFIHIVLVLMAYPLEQGLKHPSGQRALAV